MTGEMIERSFPTHGKADLTLSNISGSVSLLPGEEDQIHVKAIKRHGNGNSKRTEIEMSQDEQGKVKIVTRHKEGILSFLSFSTPCDVDYEVKLPRQCQVHISGVSSEIEARDLQGELQFSTVSGNLVLKSLTHAISATTVSGNLEGQEIQGNFRLKSVSGDMRLSGMVAASVEASTVSGDLVLQGELMGGPYTLNTVSGNVRLELPEGGSCRAEHRSVSGDLRVNLPNAKSSRTAGLQTVEVGSGGPLIASRSISGDLLIHGPGGESVAPLAESQPQVDLHSHERESTQAFSAQERLAVLERISKGEITVEEGIKTLSSK
jgi:DUF4097 and DUF4098 domain-containing protein YvlB